MIGRDRQTKTERERQTDRQRPDLAGANVGELKPQQYAVYISGMDLSGKLYAPRQRIQIKLNISHTHIILTQGQPVLARRLAG